MPRPASRSPTLIIYNLDITDGSCLLNKLWSGPLRCLAVLPMNVFLHGASTYFIAAVRNNKYTIGPEEVEEAQPWEIRKRIHRFRSLWRAKC